ncbi:MAG: amidase [Nitrososphaeria archaeon]|nr:amidase [Nitrososphaeria archaeon]
MVDLAKATIREIHQHIKNLKIKPTRLIEESLKKIDRLDNTLKMFIYIAREEALRYAERLERELEEGICRGLLHGLPFGVKDAFYTEDMPTTGGSKILKDFKPSKDAVTVSRLKDAGVVIIGKTNMHEFAFGVTNKNPHYGFTRNPWNVERISGGSSGGSAVAVSVGICIGGLGTDTAGSIRIPSALCGVVGYKTTYGLINLEGVIPLSWSLDTVGPIAKSVEDVAIILNILTDKKLDLTNITEENTNSEWRIGLPRKIIERMVSEDVEEVFWKSVDKITSYDTRLIEIDLDWFKVLSDTRYIIVLSESAAYHLKWLRNKFNDYDPDVGGRILGGLFIPAPVYIRAQKIRNTLKKKFLHLMEEKKLDGIILPTVPIEAPRVEDEEVVIKGEKMGVRRALLSLTEAFNSLGNPAITIPCGLTENKLPVGLQIATKPNQDKLLLKIAKHFEKIIGRLPEPPILS